MNETEIAEGTRVVIRIKRREAYANGCADALDGKRGTVEKTRTDPWIGPKALVLFDEPAQDWHGNGRPVTGFWFAIGELEVAS